MDGTTEPIITVIGHPIAGNPTQFALERALRSLELDWRVLSFDVKPDDVATALEGFLVTGVSGVIIDPSVGDEAGHWYAAKVAASDEVPSDDPSAPDSGDADQETTIPVGADPGSPRGGEDNEETVKSTSSDRDLDDTANHDTANDDTDADDTANDDQTRLHQPGTPSHQRIDCLRREADGSFLGSHEQLAWVDAQIEQHSGSGRIWLGRSLDCVPLIRKWFDPDAIPLPPDPESIEDADLIVITDDGDSSSLEAEEWPRDDGATWVIDLTDGHPESSVLEQRGYRVVSRLDRHIGTLQGCLRQWTGQTVSVEVIRDAIEEYLGV